MDNRLDNVGKIESEKSQEKTKEYSIVFFDGVCNLCNGLVDFMITRDNKSTLRYASLQGITAKELLPEEMISELDSLAFHTNKKIYTRSDAVILAIAQLGGLWKSILVLRIIPGFIRDPIYLYIAKNRYRWFGKRESCRMPTVEEKDSLLK